MLGQAEIARLAAELARQKEEEASRARAELEAAIAAKLRADEIEAKARQEAENFARARVELEMKAQQEAKLRAQAVEMAGEQSRSERGGGDAASYIMSAMHGGMDASVASRLRELENENVKLKKLLAEAHLDISALKTTFGVKR
jgi:putative transposase